MVSVIRISHASRVDASPAQPGQFAPPYVRERGQQDQGAVPRRNRLRDREHDRDGDDLALSGVFLTRSRDAARVAGDDPVLFGCRREDRVQQPVCLGHGDRPERTLRGFPRLQAFLAPAAHDGLVDRSHGQVAERREQVIVQEALVQLFRARLEHPVTHPLLRVLAELPFGQFGCDPGAFGDLSLLEAEPLRRVGLALEGARSRAHRAIGPSVPGLVPSRRQLGDVAELPVLVACHQAIPLPRYPRTVSGSTTPDSMNASSTDSRMRT